MGFVVNLVLAQLHILPQVIQSILTTGLWNFITKQYNKQVSKNISYKHIGAENDLKTWNSSTLDLH